MKKLAIFVSAAAILFSVSLTQAQAPKKEEKKEAPKTEKKAEPKKEVKKEEKKAEPKKEVKKEEKKAEPKKEVKK